MAKFPPALVICFAAFSIFTYFHGRHFRHFQGASPIFEFILGVSATLSMLVSLCFLVYYGYRVGWWTPFALIGLDLLIFPLGALVARLITPFGMSLLAFIAWPVLAYFMFSWNRTRPNQSMKLTAVALSICSGWTPGRGIALFEAPGERRWVRSLRNF